MVHDLVSMCAAGAPGGPDEKKPAGSAGISEQQGCVGG
jgi:hypothetical protein